MSEEVQNTEEAAKTEGGQEAAAPEQTEQQEQVAQPISLSSFYGVKKGMTAVFKEDGTRVPVTILECKPWTVTQLKREEKCGYNAVQISFSEKKAKNSNKAELGHVKAAGQEKAFKVSREVRGDIPEGCELGREVTLEGFEAGQKLQITSKSKGRGFAGAMKRYGFGGGPASHGSGFHRRPGSIGMCTFPGRVMKGKKMPGHYGNKNITVKGIEVVAVNKEENLLLVKGAVPGSVNTLVKIARKA